MKIVNDQVIQFVQEQLVTGNIDLLQFLIIETCLARSTDLGKQRRFYDSGIYYRGQTSYNGIAIY